MQNIGTWGTQAFGGATRITRGVDPGFARWPLWGLYLFLAVCLAPVLKPTGPAQVAILDGVNLVAVLLFAGLAVASGARLELPLIVPALVVAAGSLIALINAVSMSHGLLTLLQDAYLYLWFVFLVNIMRVRGALRGVRIAWVWVANAMSVLGLAMLHATSGQGLLQIFSAKGQRAVALFYGPNTYADYLMMSVFVALSLGREVRKLWLWPSILLMLTAMIATKSNGAMGSLMAGLVFWAVVRLFTKSGSRAGVLAGLLVMSGMCALGWRALSESQVIMPPTEAVTKRSIIARVERSSESRVQIWDRLLRSVERSPMGIGPGNSRFQQLNVAERERKHSARAKEAHNDYLAFTIERGPLGFLGLMLMMVMSVGAVWSGWRSGRDKAWTVGVGGALAAAMLGGLLASSVHSLVMEKLHFRHFCLFMGLLWAFRAPLPKPVVATARPVSGGTVLDPLRRSRNRTRGG